MQRAEQNRDETWYKKTQHPSSLLENTLVAPVDHGNGFWVGLV